MRRRISIRGCVRPSVRPWVRPWVRGYVSIREKRRLGASYVGYPTLFMLVLVVNVVVIPVFDLVIVVALTEFMKRIAVGMDDVNETGIRRFQSAK